MKVYYVEYKASPKRWERVKFQPLHTSAESAFDWARGLDEDGLLVNVRVRAPDGSILKPSER